MLEPWCRGRGAHNFRRALAAKEPIPGDDLGPNHPFKPSFLWDAVASLTRFPVAGVLWYQGESNAESAWRVAQHDALIESLITDWRAQWNRPTLPFLFVQLPSMKRPHWSAFRASQQSSHDSLPHTGMAVTLDLGHPTDVHPRDKKPVGERLALIAEKEVYGQAVTASGPVVNTIRRKDDGVIVKFDSADGLKTRDGQAPSGFELLGHDGEWMPAEARIDGKSIRLKCRAAAKPTAVRYGWVPFPEPRLNLINAADLPASPFFKPMKRTIKE